MMILKCENYLKNQVRENVSIQDWYKTKGSVEDTGSEGKGRP